jgi:hypothetical protein
MLDDVQALDEVICVCLNGQELRSTGSIVLQWRGKSFRKIFNTRFHIVDEETLPWEVILGAKAIREHSILRFCGFGGRCILPKKSNGMSWLAFFCALRLISSLEEKVSFLARKQQYEKTVAANEEKVMEDMKTGENSNRQFQGKSRASSASSASSTLGTSITSASHDSATY